MFWTRACYRNFTAIYISTGYWIVAYPVDNAVNPLNNWDLKTEDLKTIIRGIIVGCSEAWTRHEKKHDLIWYQTWHVLPPNIWSLAALHANFCNRNYEPETILELNSVNRHVLQFVYFVWMRKYFVSLRYGLFRRIHQKCGRQAIHFSSKVHPTACQTSIVWWPNRPRLIAN